MWMQNQAEHQKHSEYATAADFCRIFDKDMSSLYLLSLLLTGDHEKAEQCFVAGLENAANRNTVFKAWARGWARRMIIQNALRIIDPHPNVESGITNSSSIAITDNTLSERAEIAAVLRLKSFERFVFVMSVLEDYSQQDCSILLGCSRGDVLAARVRALQQIGMAAEYFRGQRESANRDVSAQTGIASYAFESELRYAKSA